MFKWRAYDGAARALLLRGRKPRLARRCDQSLLAAAAARIGELPLVSIRAGSLAVPMGDCSDLAVFAPRAAPS
jgi:hypothetical protein